MFFIGLEITVVVRFLATISSYFQFYTAPNGRQTKQNDWLVNIVENLVGKEPVISLRSWWSPKERLKGE